MAFSLFRFISQNRYRLLIMTTKQIIAIVEKLNDEAKEEFAYHLAKVTMRMVGKTIPNNVNVMVTRAWDSYVKSLV